MKMETQEIYVLTLDFEDRMFLINALIHLIDAAKKDENQEVEKECQRMLGVLEWGPR